MGNNINMDGETKKRILIVDDDEFLLKMYALKFEAEFEVDTAKNGEEVFKKAEEKKNFDLILLDIVMPSPDGFEILATIKKKDLFPNAKIIALSNLGQKEDLDKGKQLGFDDYIIKARHTPSEVAAKIKSILR